ncbi:HNH endonuclease [Agrobacterium larrymoorei]|uniref:HNH domain-containing protein n=1 Tax=Agrobacterium larrymoorei TaxID=160699 RepID=A0ABU0UDZ2_9HYPH|nr:HNH endonuclease [Agrobacterium larrymoorei]MDQ1183159.1 hypothetical protein [Agrobacterium larrymoorei]
MKEQISPYPPLRESRINAYNSQRGRCYYCGNPMWEAAIEPLEDAEKRFAENRLEKLFKTPAGNLESHRCTAEHFVPQSNGGTDDADNILAACMLCNSTRMSMDIETFRAQVRRSFFQMEAGHDRSVVNGQWVDKVAYDFRWHVTLFIEERDIWVDLFCQEFLPYTTFRKNHWHIRRNDSLVYPTFTGDFNPAALIKVWQTKEVVEGCRLLLENVSHEAVVLEKYGDKVGGSR